MNFDTGCGTYFVLGQITSSVYLLDKERTGLFNFDKSVHDHYYWASGSLALGLKKELGDKWEIYSVFIGRKDEHMRELPEVYVVRFGDSDLYMDIKGVRRRQDIIDEWNALLIGVNRIP